MKKKPDASCPKEMASFLKRDLSTIKRWTGKGRIVSNRFGDDGVPTSASKSRT